MVGPEVETSEGEGCCQRASRRISRRLPGCYAREACSRVVSGSLSSMHRELQAVGQSLFMLSDELGQRLDISWSAEEQLIVANWGSMHHTVTWTWFEDR